MAKPHRKVPATMTNVSLITLARGTANDLANMMRGVAQQRLRPFEMIVVALQHQPFELPELPFPVTQMRFTAGISRLAGARNAAAMAASGDALVFLDPICIPTSTLISDYARAADTYDGLVMGEIMYLPTSATTGEWNFEDLAAVARTPSNSRRSPAHSLELCPNPASFSLMNFAMRRETFLSTGGFDESYDGADIKFGERLNQYGIPMAWIKGGLAYHQ